MVTWSPFGVATLAVGCALVVLAGAVWRTRGGPGQAALVATLVGNGLYALAYGANLLTFDPDVSRLLEVPFWLAGELFTVTFLLFALAFTGRGKYLTGRNIAFVSLMPVATVLVAATNSLGLHELFWSDYRVVETLGAGVRAFDPGPWLYVKSTYATVLIGAGLLMFLEEILIERTLHRAQSAAIVVGTVVPLSGYSVWLLGLGPYPQTDFSPLLMAVTLVSFGYAVFAADLFETAPAVRRLGRESSIETLDEPIVITTDEGVVTDLNGAATELLGCDRAAALKRPLDSLLDGETVEFERGTQVVSVQTSTGVRTFRVTVEQTTDERGRPVGRTVLFYDITEERRRKQRLEVLNRVLRHNLRNDMTVVAGLADQIRAHTTDGAVSGWADDIDETATELVSLGEKAREFEAAIGGEVSRERVELAPLVETVVDRFRADHPAATLEVSVPTDAVVVADPRLVRLVVSNLVENAIEHHDGDAATVQVRSDGQTGDDTVVVRVSDDGPGIPEMELETLQRRTEEPLQHGQGIGLWVVAWCVRTLGGWLDIDANEDGTVVSVTLPAGVPARSTERVSA